MQDNTQKSPFSHLYGQARAKTMLMRSLCSGRIAHAYLFKGPDGVGKKLFAAAMAQALSCKVNGPQNACGSCSSCKKFISSNHPDYVVESPEKGAIKIDRVRELCKSLAYPPYESEKRVMVIEDIHTMRQEAANSLLKTLEEPPENNILILTAEASRSMLATISSRCQIIPFFPISHDETVQVLCNEEHGIDREQASLLARLAEGSPGRALILHKTEMVETWKSVTHLLTDEKFCEDSNSGLVLQLAEQMAALKENLVPLLGLLRLWVRDILVQSTLKNETFPVADKEVEGISEKLSIEKNFSKLLALDRAEQQLARNCNRALVCEVLLFRLQ